jgi:hypothetical protein
MPAIWKRVPINHVGGGSAWAFHSAKEHEAFWNGDLEYEPRKRVMEVPVTNPDVMCGREK